MRATARLALPLAGAVLGMTAATAFHPAAVQHTPVSPCGTEQVTVQLSPLYDLQRAGASTPADAVRALLDTDATAGLRDLDLQALRLVGSDDGVRLLSGDVQVGLAATWELPAGGHAVDALVLCLPEGPR